LPGMLWRKAPRWLPNGLEDDWLMIQVVRRSLAIASACGLLASVVLYIESYCGATMNRIARWAIVLHIGIFALFAPMCAIEYSSIRQRSFFYKGFAREMPKWVAPSINLLGLFFAIHFVLFLVQSHAAVPEIRNGVYVLNDHGRIVRALTQSEYFTRKGAELRLFATGWLFFYFVLTAYWWFPRIRQQPV
jgi:hypothetical protein